ncbi:DUF2191 domain-containing protein [bacterium]|nr:MAG: DUF2191 domain-containing protein [bacterium]
MRTTLNIPDELIKRVQKIYSEKSKSRAVEKALRELLEIYAGKKLSELAGKIEVELTPEEIEKGRTR